MTAMDGLVGGISILGSGLDGAVLRPSKFFAISSATFPAVATGVESGAEDSWASSEIGSAETVGF